MYKKILATLAIIIAGFALSADYSPAYAAEARLNIKARIVRCVSQAERRQMCETENLCCNLLDTEVAMEEQADEVHQQSYENVPAAAAAGGLYQQGAYTLSMKADERGRTISVE